MFGFVPPYFHSILIGQTNFLPNSLEISEKFKVSRIVDPRVAGIRDQGAIEFPIAPLSGDCRLDLIHGAVDKRQTPPLSALGHPDPNPGDPQMTMGQCEGYPAFTIHHPLSTIFQPLQKSLNNVSNYSTVKRLFQNVFMEMLQTTTFLGVPANFRFN